MCTEGLSVFVVDGCPCVCKAWELADVRPTTVQTLGSFYSKTTYRHAFFTSSYRGGWARVVRPFLRVSSWVARTTNFTSLLSDAMQFGRRLALMACSREKRCFWFVETSLAV